MNSPTFVPPSGPPNAKIYIIGEQPGKTELKLRKPFVGPAGENLDECLRAAKISRGDCYFSNVIKDLDFPLSEYITLTGGKNSHGEFTKLGTSYLEVLKEEISQNPPNVILACGNIALWALTSRIGITVWRGSILDSTLVPGIKVIPTFHPATWTPEKLYTDPSAYLNKYLVIMDLKKVKLESEFPDTRLLDRKLLIRPSYPESLEFLHECWEKGKKGSIIDYDIELTPGSQELSCISLAINRQYCMSIAFVDAGGDIFSISQETQIMKQIARILEAPSIMKEGQNLIFDSHFLYRKYGIFTYNYHDTMVAQKILYPDFCGSVDPVTGKPTGTPHHGAALQFITAMWTDIPYYKKDGKIWLGGSGTWENGWKYNCLDSLSCADAGPKQREELKKAGNLSTYQRQMKLIEPLTFMMERGILIDLNGMKTTQLQNVKKIEDLSQTLYSLMGKKINLNSPLQLCEYFYNTKKIKPYLNPDTKNPTVGINALKRLASIHKLPEASLILELRKLSKENSTFLDPSKVDSDSRIRCSYNPVGTRFSRISSSKNIFGTGLNLQNVPHHCLTYFVADPGYVIYSLDYSQYENRIVAYVGNIRQMIEVFEDGLDSHRMTAALILSIMGQPTRYDEVIPDERQEFGKRPNHAFNYGFGPNNFALLYELPQSLGKKIYNAYHTAYPGLRLDYWKYVQNELRRNRTLTNLMDRKVTFLGQWSESLLSEAYSCIPQGTCGDCINERGISFTYYNNDPLFKDVELLTQIHDSMEIQIPLDTPVLDHAKILIKIKESLEEPLEFKGRIIHTPVDLVVNTCLNKDVGVELKGERFSLNPEILSDNLEEAGEKLGINYLPF